MIAKSTIVSGGTFDGWRVRVVGGVPEARAMPRHEWGRAPLRLFARHYGVGEGPWPFLLAQGVRRPSPSGPSGAPQSAADRRAAGRVRLDAWISAEASERLDALAAEWRCTRRDALERLVSGGH